MGIDERLTEIADTLLAQTGADRTVIRLDLPDKETFAVVAEALAEGVQATRGMEANIKAPTFVLLEREQRAIIQNDVLTSPPVFPENLTTYGNRAQMLAPVVLEGRLVGIVAVHCTAETGPREWTTEDIAHLVDAASRTESELKQIL